MARLLLCVLCVVLLTHSAQGCGWLDFMCKARDKIEEAGSKLIGEAKQAFEQAMDYVFDKDIVPLVDKLEAAINAGIDKIDKDVNDTINHIQTVMDQIIDQAAQDANALASNVTKDIEQIIDKATSSFMKLEQTFYQDASNLLEKINDIVEKGQCMEASGAKQIQNGIYKLLKSLDPFYRVSSCWRSLGYKITWSLEDLTEIQLYDFQKACTLLNRITPTTPIKGPGGILETYAQGQLYAAQYYCIGETANAPAFQNTLTKEWVWWGVQYDLWNHVGKKF